MCIDILILLRSRIHAFERAYLLGRPKAVGLWERVATGRHL
ncbi:hypothetical protein ALQ24_200007 [Pseudomonas syringae pv. antirrhini]|nr:hypothetical protein ALQ24_200007 [Pseudomonas syringae pv. antirrhini]